MKNPLFISFCASAALHLALFASLPGVRFQNAERPEFKELEIIAEDPVYSQENRVIEQEEMSLVDPPEFLEEFAKKTIFDSPVDYELEKATLDQPSKEIFFSELDMETLAEIKKTPAYMDYYRLIREKIRDNALRQYRQSAQGIVHLSFIIRHDGNLHRLELADDSTGGGDLFQIALNSVNHSAPFPPFPLDLDYPFLQFNVSIHFKSN